MRVPPARSRVLCACLLARCRPLRVPPARLLVCCGPRRWRSPAISPAGSPTSPTPVVGRVADSGAHQATKACRRGEEVPRAAYPGPATSRVRKAEWRARVPMASRARRQRLPPPRPQVKTSGSLPSVQHRLRAKLIPAAFTIPNGCRGRSQLSLATHDPAGELRSRSVRCSLWRSAWTNAAIPSRAPRSH